MIGYGNSAATCEDVAGLLALTEDADPKERVRALRSLCPCHLRRDISAVWDRVIALAHDPDARVRRHVLHTLGDGSPNARRDEVVHAIGVLALDADERIRRRARGVLAAFRRTGRINVL